MTEAADALPSSPSKAWQYFPCFSLCSRPKGNKLNWEKKSPKSLLLIFPHEQHLPFRQGPELNPDLV